MTLLKLLKTKSFIVIISLFFTISTFAQPTKQLEFNIVDSKLLSANIDDWKYNESFFLTVNNNSTQNIEARPIIKIEDDKHSLLTNLCEEVVLSFEPRTNKLVSGNRFLKSNCVDFKKFENNKTYYLEIALQPIDNDVVFETKNYKVSCRNNSITLLDLNQNYVEKKDINVENVFLASQNEKYNYSYGNRNNNQVSSQASNFQYNSYNNQYNPYNPKNSPNSSNNNTQSYTDNNSINEELLVIVSQLSSILSKVIEPTMKNYEKYITNEIFTSNKKSTLKGESNAKESSTNIIKSSLDKLTEVIDPSIKITNKKPNPYQLNIENPITEEDVELGKGKALILKDVEENSIMTDEIELIEVETPNMEVNCELIELAEFRINERKEAKLVAEKIESIDNENLDIKEDYLTEKQKDVSIIENEILKDSEDVNNQDFEEESLIKEQVVDNNMDNEILKGSANLDSTSENPVYKVEFLKLRNKMDLDLSYYSHLAGYEVVYSEEDNHYHYFIGNYDSEMEASNFLNDIQEKHKSAKLIVDQNQNILYTYLDK